METLIQLDDVSFSYGRIPVVKNINLSIGKGEFLGIVGPNAGGKSTLLKLILGLLQPDKGKITVNGLPPQQGRAKIGYVPQYPTFLRDFPINVQETVLLGRLRDTRWYGRYLKHDYEMSEKVMKEIEIDDIQYQSIGSLSGGQLQRVLIARALVSQPEILILDEPTANIDMRMEEDIFGLLKQFNDHMIIIVVSHDIGFISGYVNRVACLNQTLVCHSTEEISGKTIEGLYGTPVRMIQHAH